MYFISDDDREKLERFLRAKVRMAIEEPELDELVSSYIIPVETFINTYVEISDDWDALKGIGKDKIKEIDYMIERLDAILVNMDEYDVRTVKIDMLQLESALDDEDFKMVVRRLIESVIVILSDLRSASDELKKEMLSLKEKIETGET